MWNVSTDGDAASPVVRRSKEVRAVLKKRPAASEEQGGMPSPLRERLEGGGFDSIAELLPLYQQWGLRNGPAAAEDAQSRAASLNSDKPLISVFHGWMMADKHGPESWVNSFDGTIEQKAVLESALRSTRGY